MRVPSKTAVAAACVGAVVGVHTTLWLILPLAHLELVGPELMGVLWIGLVAGAALGLLIFALSRRARSTAQPEHEPDHELAALRASEPSSEQPSPPAPAEHQA